MNYVEIILTCLFLFNILILYTIKNQTKPANNVSDEYQTSLSALLFIVHAYKFKYDLEITKLRTRFDTDINSQTKALEPFKEECNKVMSESLKKINKLISEELRESLSKFYSFEGFLFIIMEELKK